MTKTVYIPVPVKERLPEKRRETDSLTKTVLVQYTGQDLGFGYYSHFDSKWFSLKNIPIKVTHWLEPQELPVSGYTEKQMLEYSNEQRLLCEKSIREMNFGVYVDNVQLRGGITNIIANTLPPPLPSPEGQPKPIVDDFGGILKPKERVNQEMLKAAGKMLEQFSVDTVEKTGHYRHKLDHKELYKVVADLEIAIASAENQPK